MAGDGGRSSAEEGGAAAQPAPPKARFAVRFRLPIAVAALVAWMLITTLNPLNGPASGGLVGAIANGPQWGIGFAVLFLLALTASCRWGDLGFNAPTSARSLRLLWLPSIYLVIFGVTAAVLGPPPLPMVGFMALNVTLGAFSEETMFRGVLFGALRTRLRPWSAVLIASVLFGLAHLVNAAVFGSFKIAAAQAVAATMSGLVFIAIRLRTGSLVPAIVYHGLWDFASLMAVAGAMSHAATATATGAAENAMPGADTTLPMLLAPVLLLLPNFLYALFLLRHLGKPPADPQASTT